MFDVIQARLVANRAHTVHCRTWLREACDRIEALERENAAMAKAVAVTRAWAEYFGAIEDGEYPDSRPRIRTFEKVLLDRSRDALAALASPKAPATSKETP